MSTTKSHHKFLFVFLVTICCCIDAIPFAQEDELSNEEEPVDNGMGNEGAEEKVASRIFGSH